MNAAKARTLANIASKPGASRRDTLTVTRRAVRSLCQRYEAIHDERRAMRRKAAKLPRDLTFTKRAAERLEKQAQAHHAKELGNIRSMLLGYGRLILLDGAGYAEALGFDALADVLNINRIDREEARRERWRTLADLVAVHDLENSSERRSNEWGAGSPLNQACQLALAEFIRTAPEGALPDPFAPGEIFGPKLPPALRIVGK